MEVIEGPNGPCPRLNDRPNHDWDNSKYGQSTEGSEYDLICRKCGQMLIMEFIPNMISKDWREDDKN